MAAQIREGVCRGARRCFHRAGLQGGGADPGRGAAGAAAQLLRGECRRRRRGSTAGTDDAVGRIDAGVGEEKALDSHAALKESEVHVYSALLR